MLTSPILRYELLALGRRRRYFLLRGIYVLGLLSALWLCYLEAFGWYGWDGYSVLSAYAHLAEYFFAAFAGIQLGAILLLTPATVAGTIAGEHERRTIDYLLTTHLTDGEITLCKFAARMATLVYQLLVGLPVLALVMLFGGIAPETLVEVFGYSALILVGTASLSLWISASCRTTRVAITTAYLAVIVLGGLPLLCQLAIETLGDGPGGTSVGQAVWIWNLWSPILLLIGCFEPDMTANQAQWHRPEFIVPLYLTASAVWLGLAVRALRRTHAAVGGRSWFARRQCVKPPRPVGRFAMYWKETICQRTALRLGGIGRAATVVLFLSAYATLGCAIYSTIERELHYRETKGWWGTSDDPFGYSQPFRYCPLFETSYATNAIVGTFVLLLVAARAAGSVTSEKEQDSWLTLLSTPLTGAEIVFAKIGGALYSVRYWYLFLVVFWLCDAIRFPFYLAFLPVLSAVHLLLGWMFAATGVYFSLKFKSSLWSIGATIALLAIVTGALPLIGVFLLEKVGGEADPQYMLLGFVAPVTLFGPECLLVGMCGGYDWNKTDSQVAASIGTALLLYGLAAVALTVDLVRRFADLTGRLDDDSFEIGSSRPPGGATASNSAETVTEATR